MSDKAKAIFREHRKLFIMAALLLVMIIGAIVGYNNYLDNKLYAEGSQDIATTYRQTAKAFSLYTQRNFNYLNDLDTYLYYYDKADALENQFAEYAARNNNWGYTDVFLFNEAHDYLTTTARVGNDDTSSALDQLYVDGEPLVSSYMADSNTRKVVFARLLSKPIVIGGVSYTGIAVSYTNTHLQDLMDSGAYGENSDCYVVRENGDVVFALETKSVLHDFVVNVNDYFASNAAFERGDGDSFAASIAAGEIGHALLDVDGKKAYAVTVPSGVDGLALVSVVKDGAVDAKIIEVRNVTTFVLSLVLLLVAFSTFWLLYDRFSHELEDKEAARHELDQKSEQTLQLFRGVAGVFDRFAVCDLVNDTYVYHENTLATPLYPLEGSYRDLISHISREYDLIHAKEDQTPATFLSPGYLRSVLGGETSYVSFEYVSKENGTSLRMNGVPVGWDLDGSVTKVLLFAQNIDSQVELEALAKTDGLTGLLNKRSYIDLLGKLERKSRPYTLYFLDLDRFKQVNDTYGHDAGDKLLQEVAYRLRSCVRSSDYVFRLGGDEFALVTPGDYDERFSAILSARIERSVQQAVEVDGNELFVGTSCGFAGFPVEGETSEEIEGLADARMYRQKQTHHEGR